MFGNNFAQVLIDLMLHYQDYSLSITKIQVQDKDPIEYWIQNIWNHVKSLFNIENTIEEIEDLVVDISQGSKRTLLGSISPYIYKNKADILKWAEETKVQTITKSFLNEDDRLIALSFHYLNAFPDKKKEKADLEKEHGIHFIEETYGTGIQVVLINVNKLNGSYMDPNVKYNQISKNHLILHIGYTFGAQSSQIIRPLIMLFGSKARSFNVIGKAGGLAGKRTEIMCANKIFHDKTNDMCTVNYGNMDVEQLKKSANTNIHVGPMLTVAGTILQNNDLLHYYKRIMGCIGLEMEGFYYANYCEMSKKSGLLKENFVCRCFYYTSDLPLDPTQNLSQEGENVNWDEGVCSMNAIQRFILNQFFTN